MDLSRIYALTRLVSVNHSRCLTFAVFSNFASVNCMIVLLSSVPSTASLNPMKRKTTVWIVLGDFLTAGLAIAGVIGALIVGTASGPYRSSSNLESATYSLVNEKERTIVDQELLTVTRKLPSDLQSLSKEQRIQLYEVISVYSSLELLKQSVLSVRD